MSCDYCTEGIVAVRIAVVVVEVKAPRIDTVAIVVTT
jgi:hypothetical protein